MIGLVAVVDGDEMWLWKNNNNSVIVVLAGVFDP